MKHDTIKTYTIKPGDIVETERKGKTPIQHKVECFIPFRYVRVSNPGNPSDIYDIDITSIKRIIPTNPCPHTPASIAATVACGTPPAPTQSTTSHP